MITGYMASQIAHLEQEANPQSMAREEKLRDDMLTNDYSTWQSCVTVSEKPQPINSLQSIRVRRWWKIRFTRHTPPSYSIRGRSKADRGQ